MSPKLQRILDEAQLEMGGNVQAFSTIVRAKISAFPPDEAKALNDELELLKGFGESGPPEYLN